MKYICTTERWISMGQPDLNSRIYLYDRKTSKRNWFQIVGIDYGNKKALK